MRFRHGRIHVRQLPVSVLLATLHPDANEDFYPNRDFYSNSNADAYADPDEYFYAD